MSSKRKNVSQNEDEEGLSKEQDEIARFVRFNCPTNSTLFEGNEVHYFTGSKAVDTLYESSYGTKAKGEPKFSSRVAAANYMKTLMEMKCFFRAKKLVAKKKEDKKTKVDEDKKKKEEETETESEQKEKPSDEKKENKEENKKKKKIKLEVHVSQAFHDDKDVYVWVFDPTPLYKKIIGLLMLLGTIAGCLYPIWPEWLRMGVYYLSMTGVGAVGLLIVVALARTVLFCIIWLVTLGQHKLWILPNLTEDCGFFESFQPYYTYEYCPRGATPAKKDEKKKRKKDKESDNEEGSVAKESPAEKKEKGSESGSPSVSNSEDDQSAAGSASEAGSAPATPADASVKKRRVRRADDDFVVVNN